MLTTEIDTTDDGTQPTEHGGSSRAIDRQFNKVLKPNWELVMQWMQQK
jgi:hypothetical protein